jgi:hypothetical protein
MAAAALNAMTRKRGGDMWQPADFFPSLGDGTAQTTSGSGMAERLRNQIAEYKGPTNMASGLRKRA